MNEVKTRNFGENNTCSGRIPKGKDRDCAQERPVERERKRERKSEKVRKT